MMMFRPYLLKLTASEFHAFIVSGHATVAGFAFGIFTFMGVSKRHTIESLDQRQTIENLAQHLRWPNAVRNTSNPYARKGS